MSRSRRQFFLTRALREKFLLLAFLGIGVLWWFSAYNRRAAVFWREQRATGSQLAVQSQWLKNKSVIEQTAQKTAGRFNAAKTLNGNQLITAVTTVASEVGLKNTTGGSSTVTPSGKFMIHSAEFTIRNVNFDAVRKLDDALQGRAPYLAVERFVLSPLPSNPSDLTANLRVVSVEILP